jgi:hypothetical protein
MLRISVLSVLLCLYFSPTTAQELTTITVNSGVESRVGQAYFCSIPQQIPNIIILEYPQHGTLNVKEFPSGSPCGNGRVAKLFYTSQPGYKGSDGIAYQIDFGQRGHGAPMLHLRRNIVVK